MTFTKSEFHRSGCPTSLARFVSPPTPQREYPCRPSVSTLTEKFADFWRSTDETTAPGSTETHAERPTQTRSAPTTNSLMRNRIAFKLHWYVADSAHGKIVITRREQVRSACSSTSARSCQYQRFQLSAPSPVQAVNAVRSRPRWHLAKGRWQEQFRPSAFQRPVSAAVQTIHRGPVTRRSPSNSTLSRHSTSSACGKCP